MTNWVARFTFQLGLAAILSGCGGGGGDSGDQNASNASFPLFAANKTRALTGSIDNFSISGSCSGTATITNAPVVAASFEGTTGYAGTQTTTLSFTSCNQLSGAATGTQYFDQNYTMIGFNIPGQEYAKLATAPTPVPEAVRVGDTAVFATLNTYQDSTKTTPKGQRQVSYVIESDTSTTAIANLITKGYNTSGQLLYTNQTRYRLSTVGTLSIISIDVQYSTTSTLHLIFTKA